MSPRIVSAALLVSLVSVFVMPSALAANDTFNKQLTSKYSSMTELKANISVTINSFLRETIDLVFDLRETRKDGDTSAEIEAEAKINAEFDQFYRDVVRYRATVAAMMWGW